MKILVAEFRKMFPGDHAKPSTEALCNYDVHIDHGDDYVAEVRFVNVVTAGGSVKLLPEVYISPETTQFTI